MVSIARDPDESADAFLLRYLTTVTEEMVVTQLPTLSYACYEHLVLTLGRPYTAQPLSPLATYGEPKKCYANTLQLVRELPTIQYVEGFAYHAGTGIAYLHAWGADTLGLVWDRTWEDTAGCAYYGIPFPRADLERFDALGPDYLGIIESHYLLGSPLMKTGRLFPPGA